MQTAASQNLSCLIENFAVSSDRAIQVTFPCRNHLLASVALNTAAAVIAVVAIAVVAIVAAAAAVLGASGRAAIPSHLERAGQISVTM
jgi:VanZ family protein